MLIARNFIRLSNVVAKNRRSYTKLSYRHFIGEDPLRSLTLGTLLEDIAGKYPERLAIISRHQKKRLTFKQSLQEADKLAAGLRKLGLQTGDRFGLWAPNLIEWYITKLACTRAGLIMVAINPGYTPSEMEYCINKVGIKAIVCPSKMRNQNFYENLLTVAPELQTSAPGKLNSSKVPSLKSVIIIDDETFKGTFGYQEILESADTKEIKSIGRNQHLVRPDDAFNIQFTSGTTGKPKAAVVSHFNIVNNSYFIGKRNEFNRKHHRVCVQVPFFHAFGLVITISACLNHGTTMVLPSAYYSPTCNLEAIKEEKCTILHGTPTMYVDLVHKQLQRNEDISPEIAVAGGAPCPPHLFEEMLRVLRLKTVKSIYGLTETTGSVFQSLPGEDASRSTSTVGHIQEHLEAKVVDSENHIVPLGTPGELCIRGYTTMLGYWDDEKKTKETIGSDAWLRTGDQFVLQEDGYGMVVGRLKELIIRGGENIFPREIEDFLIKHPDIIEAYVIGIPHKRLGEEVCACIKLTKNAKIKSEDIKRYCEGKIAQFKVPSIIKIVQEFPKTTSGKIQKFKLVEMVVEKIK